MGAYKDDVAITLDLWAPDVAARTSAVMVVSGVGLRVRSTRPLATSMHLPPRADRAWRIDADSDLLLTYPGSTRWEGEVQVFPLTLRDPVAASRSYLGPFLRVNDMDDKPSESEQ
jgi:hypothetical protein